MGGYFTGKPLNIYRNEPDETEGRKLYRNEANALAHRQLAYEKRIVRLAKHGGDKP